MRRPPDVAISWVNAVLQQLRQPLREHRTQAPRDGRGDRLLGDGRDSPPQRHGAAAAHRQPGSDHARARADSSLPAAGEISRPICGNGSPPRPGARARSGSTSTSTRRVFFKPEGVVRTARANHGRSNRSPLVTPFIQRPPRATDMSSAPPFMSCASSIPTAATCLLLEGRTA